MAADPPPERDPLFDDVEAWQADLDRRYSDWLGVTVAVVVFLLVVALVLIMVLNSG